MFGPFDHVGYLVRDFDAALEQAQVLFALPLARRADLPQFRIRAAFLGEGTGTLEIFTFDDPELLDPRLDGAERRIDHVAFRVDDLDAVVELLRAGGARFSGPDRRGEVSEAIALGANRVLWTLPQTTGGLALQLIEPPAQ
jgi:catechol 2,3-dioxygenase-like lactoylglutathione lyase family enzyme